jgi:hypothetical protein
VTAGRDDGLGATGGRDDDGLGAFGRHDGVGAGRGGWDDAVRDPASAVEAPGGSEREFDMCPLRVPLFVAQAGPRFQRKGSVEARRGARRAQRGYR